MARRKPHWTGGTEFVSGAVTGAAILLFVATGSVALTSLVGQAGGGPAPDGTMTTALVLNVALILFGWFRHRRLAEEVMALTRAGERAEALAARDPLTGLSSRRAMADDAEGLFRLAARRRKAVAAVMLDLDHFKAVNDAHGHALGDTLLRQVAMEMQAVVPQTSAVARLGGDEFAACMIFDPADPGAVERVAEQLVARLARPFYAEGAELHVSGSVGIARSDQDREEFDALLRAADIAMYAAKSGGRNRYAWFDESMERELRTRSELERDLRAAIPRGEVVPFFEQQVDLSTGRLTGFEVLARWEHPARGLVPADQFLPAAEECGLIGELSASVMRQAFGVARDWDPSLTLSVNVSPAQLKDAWLAQKIIKTLTETGFPAHRLEVEVTEAALFSNMALARTVIGSLKNQGVRVALDDFGTGYSSLGHLRALPFDRIKVDRSFVSSIGEAPENAAVVNAVVRLGESLNLPVTAEGIEDAAAEARLRAMGCERGQGYLYGRPMSAAHARRLLAEKRLLAGQAAGGEAEPRRRAG